MTEQGDLAVKPFCRLQKLPRSVLYAEVMPVGIENLFPAHRLYIRGRVARKKVAVSAYYMKAFIGELTAHILNIRRNISQEKDML